MSVNLVWKVATSVSNDLLRPSDIDGRYFSAGSNTGFYSQFSLPLKYAYVPLVLTPTATYSDAVRSSAARTGQPLSDKKLPFHLDILGLGTCAVSLQFRMFPPGIVTATVRVKTEGPISDQSSDSLFWLRNPRSVPAIRWLVDFAFNLLDGMATNKPSQPRDVYTGFHLTSSDNLDESEQRWTDSRKRVVGLLIGNKNYAHMDDGIVDSIEDAAIELNRKNRHEHLVQNKQGIILVAPPESTATRQSSRLNRSMDLAELGMVLRVFLDRMYPARRNGQEPLMDYLFTVATAWIENPEAILNNSYSNTLQWQLVSREFGLPAKLKLLQAENPWLTKVIESRSEYFAAISTDWWATDEFASSILDRARKQDSQYLAFIDDHDVRASIASDVREAERSLTAGNYKSAVVLAGSAAEAILLTLLEQSGLVPVKPLYDQGLKNYVEAVRKHGLFRDDGLLNMIDSTLREWRNLVHPGRVRRTGNDLNRDKAELAVKTVHAITSELSRYP